MLFNSIAFLLFFSVVVLLYFALRHRYRWLLLLLASCVFYAAFIPSYLLILFSLILVDYTSAIFIEKSSGKYRKRWLLISIISTCTILFVFKYFNFFSFNAGRIATLLHWQYAPPLLKILLPIGLSFHTFQSLSYVVEVYHGKQKAEKHLGIYTLYVMFFPQLVAGPIERPQNLLHQFREPHNLNYDDISTGLRQMLYGYFKKMVIADNLAPYVDIVYRHPAGTTGNMTIVAVIFFAIQIYCDFSGYSDIALGAARIMGFRLMTNFSFPYFSHSIAVFWRRWHISLSTWFRDYVFIPLGGSRVSKLRTWYNLFLVFLLSALWHGAGWTFVIWGLLHAVYLILSDVVSPSSRFPTLGASRLYNWLSILVTFTLTSFAWIFFRAASVPNALAVIHQLSFHPATFITDSLLLANKVHMADAERVPLLYVLVSLFFFTISEVYLYKKPSFVIRTLAYRPIRWAVYYTAIVCIFFLGVYDVTPNFIYFQF
ncbi:MAG: MBOAT family protein [Taibaiella sp.]|nr:MBOAT family protein [Taibaiella sp.]